MKSVTNMHFSFVPAQLAIEVVCDLRRRRLLELRALIRVLATAMNSAAGTPLSETSPTQKKRWVPSTK
jgi:hypothetical protein